jgi:RNA polymerase sigma-70 factor (ECF subfamily)
MGFLGDAALTRPARPTEAPDERAHIAAARRDRQAFEPLYDHYANPIYQYCHQRLGSREAAEDATSLVFAKALDALPHYRDGAFRSWLFTIAHNVVVDHVRADRHEARLDVVEAMAAPGPSLEDLVQTTDARDRLHRLLTHLSPDQREVIELRLMELNGPEIAHVLGRSHAWVKVVQFRAINRLRALLRAGADVTEVYDVSQ